MDSGLPLPFSMAATIELTPSQPMSHHGRDPLFSPKPVVGPLTEGLAQGLGYGMEAAPVPAPTIAELPPSSLPMPPVISEVKTAVMDFMLQTMQGLKLEKQSAAGLETMRMQMFGRYYEELEGRMKELRQVLDGGVSRARKAMLDRVDELGAALHRDTVSLRQEVQKELEDLKRDVFTTVTKALTDRIEQQSNSCNEAISSFGGSLDQSLEQRVVITLESTLMRMAAARRGAEPAST